MHLLNITKVHCKSTDLQKESYPLISDPVHQFPICAGLHSAQQPLLVPAPTSVLQQTKAVQVLEPLPAIEEYGLVLNEAHYFQAILRK